MATREPARWGMDDLSRLIALGASPRGTLGLLSAARALAVLRGRRYAVPQDVYDVAPEVLRHRITLTYDALAEGVHPEAVVESLLQQGAGAEHLAAAGRVHQRRGDRTDGRGMIAPLLSMPAARTAAARAQVLRRLELAVAHRLEGRDSGDHASYAYGPGSERAGARPYAPGDDARLVDWNLTARSGEVCVRQTEADRELETWVVADRSASLDFGTTDCEKRDVASAPTAAFGVLLAARQQPLRPRADRSPGRSGCYPRARVAPLCSPGWRPSTTPRARTAPPNRSTTSRPPSRRLRGGRPAPWPRRGRLRLPQRRPVGGAAAGVGPPAPVVGVHVTDPRELDTAGGRHRRRRGYRDRTAAVRRQRPRGFAHRYAAAAARRQREIVPRIEARPAPRTCTCRPTGTGWPTRCRSPPRRHRARRARPSDAAIARFSPAVAR